jgi:hypothetical protein
MSLNTLKGLTQIENSNTPIPDSVTNYLLTNLATGSGQYGTLTVDDFLGTSSGNQVVQNLQQSVSTLESMNLTALEGIYADMLATVQGSYGPFSGNVVIPSGPAAGTYPNGDDAFTSGLIPAALSEISSLISVYPDKTDKLNTAFNSICQQIEDEADFQVQAGVNFDDLPANNRFSVLSFVDSLPGYGIDNSPGGTADYLNTVADFGNLTGQAIIGSMREARNAVALDQAGLGRSNQIPSTWPGPDNEGGLSPILVANAPTQQPGVPLAAPEYQTTLNSFSVAYSTSAARAEITASPAPSLTTKVELLAISGSNTVPDLNWVEAGSNFQLQIRVQPSYSGQLLTLRSTAASDAVVYSLTDQANTQQGLLITVPGWMVPGTGSTNLTAQFGSTRAARAVTVVGSVTRQTVTITQLGWFDYVNRVEINSRVSLVITGQPGSSFVYTGALGQGSGTLSGSGSATISGLAAPPAGTYAVAVVFGSTGQTVIQNFTVSG